MQLRIVLATGKNLTTNKQASPRRGANSARREGEGFDPTAATSVDSVSGKSVNGENDSEVEGGGFPAVDIRRE